jgi:hypothetical protein
VSSLTIAFIQNDFPRRLYFVSCPPMYAGNIGKIGSAFSVGNIDNQLTTWSKQAQTFIPDAIQKIMGFIEILILI